MKNVAIDMSQLFYMNVFARVGDDFEESEELVTKMLEGSLRLIEKTFGHARYFLCYDHHKSWRKDYYPQYKGQRKKDESIDWDTLMLGFNAFKSMPTPTNRKPFMVPKAEGDDVIAYLAHRHKKLIIVSGDKDFKQLLTDTIKQYDPRTKEYIEKPTPEWLLEHLIKGDRSDNIPNIFTEEIVAGSRQKPVTKKFLKSIGDIPIEDLPDKLGDNKYRFLRNKALIDLTCIDKVVWRDMEREYNRIVPQVTTKSIFDKRREAQHVPEGLIGSLF